MILMTQSGSKFLIKVFKLPLKVNPCLISDFGITQHPTDTSVESGGIVTVTCATNIDSSFKWLLNISQLQKIFSLDIDLVEIYLSYRSLPCNERILLTLIILKGSIMGRR